MENVLLTSEVPLVPFQGDFKLFFLIMLWFGNNISNSDRFENQVNLCPSIWSAKEILILCNFTHFSHRPVKCVITSAARQRDKEWQS